MHPLLKQVRSVTHRARRLILCVAFSRWLGLMLVAVAVLALADYLFRFREAPLRWLLLSGLVFVAVWRWRKSISPALNERWSDRQIAQWIERGFPELRERLSSSVTFLRTPAGDARFGSDTLRADVVRGTEALVANRDLTQILDARPARRALGVLMGLAAVVGALFAWDSDSVSRAVRRLAMPWSAEAWPKKHRLEFTRRPEVLTRGQDFDVELVDKNGRLPSDVVILYWFAGDDEQQIRVQRMTFSGGKMVHRLPSVTESFQYRAVGGDDREMPWTPLRVVVPPRLVESRITVRPPAYAGLKTETQERRIRALAGSSVELEVEFDQPLSAAVLVFQTGNVEQRLSTRHGADGRRFTLAGLNRQPWNLPASGTYSWELTDRDGVTMTIEAGTEVEVVPDFPPEIVIESPTEGAAYTSRAIVPLRLQVKDDLAVERVELRLGDSVQALAQFPQPSEMSLEVGRPGDSRRVEYDWDLAKILAVTPENEVAFQLVAFDFKPQESQSERGAFRIRVISDDQFQQRLDREQASLLRQLMEALQLERTLHQQTGAILTQARSAVGLRPEDSAVWSALSPAQRRVAGLLDGDEGIRGQVARLLQTLAENRWEVPELVAHLSEIERRTSEISAKMIPPILQQLSNAERSLRFEPPDRNAVAASWSDALGGQEHVITELESLIDLLGQWNHFRNLSQEVRQALDEHSEIGHEIDQVQTAGRDISQLSDEERSPLEKLSRRLTDLAGQIERLQLRLDQLHQRLEQSNPAAAKALRDGLKVLEQDPVSGDLRQAGQSVAENRLGSASRDLESTRRSLEKLLAALEQQPEPNARELEQKLARALAGLAERQSAVVEETKVWGKESPGEALNAAARELAVRQSDLAKETSELARGMPESSGYVLALQLAARPMNQAGRRLASRQVGDETVRIERRALDFLKDLIASLSQSTESNRQHPEAESATPPDGDSPTARQPSLAELKLSRLVQLEILQRTAELEDARVQRPEWSADQRQELEDLSGQQRRLAELLETWSTPEQASPPPSTQPDSSSLQRPAPQRRPRSEWVFVAWTQAVGAADQPPSQNTPRPPASPLDRSLLDDVPPPRRSGKSAGAAGEDIGQPSRDGSPIAQLGRQMRKIESLLEGGDTSPPTQQLQRRVAAQLTTLIEEQQKQQQPGDPQKSQPNDDQQSNRPPASPTPTPKPGSQSGERPGSGVGGTGTDSEAISNWAKGVWGVLPDRVRQQIQDLGDEQFLPEYEQVIRDYYRRLSEKGR